MSARAEMLEELREGGSGTARQLAERVGMNVETARRALRQLERDGVVWGDSYQKRARVYGLEDEDVGAETVPARLIILLSLWCKGERTEGAVEMGTYRERRLARADRLREWSGGNAAKGAAARAESDRIGGMIPFGQPILVGHHSERRHRKDIERIRGGMDKAMELGQKAQRQASAAAEIEAQAARAIYDDDPDAIERLTEKVAALEAERERIKAKRAEIRKAGGAELRAKTAYEREEVMRAAGAPQYRVANLGGTITQTRDRLARLQREKVQGPRDRMITARFASRCAECGAALEKGSMIRYNRQQGARCASCPTQDGGA